MTNNSKKLILSALLLSLISGCGSVPAQIAALESSTKANIETQREKAAQPVPVITSVSTSWLMGQTVEVIPAQSPILARVFTYHPTQRVSLADVAAWVTLNTGLKVETSEAQIAPPATTTTPTASVAAVTPGMTTSASQQNQLFTISYEGPLSGLMDAAANKAGLWWKFDAGRLSFYRTETRTFYLPALARSSTGSGSIAAIAESGSSSSSSGGGSGSASSGGSSGGQGDSSGGSSASSNYAVDVWKNIEKTAKGVSGGAQVIADSSLGSLTVTGTPGQVRQLSDWVKNLSENLGQQVSITMQIYKVQISNAQNYSWDPTVVFKGVATKYGFSVSGPQSPAITSGQTPFSLVGSVLDTATGGQAQYTGSQLAFQALSTLGKVTESKINTVVTMNGQPATTQIANKISYLASTTQAATAIGTTPSAPTLTPGVVTVGYTGMFLPRIVNGKVLLSMDISIASLNSMLTAGTADNYIQTPNISSSTFEQNVSVTPGDTLMLTGVEQDTANANQSGVGPANNYIFGGGVGNTTDKLLVAIVLTVKVL